jgi:hypothetical protein
LYLENRAPRRVRRHRSLAVQHLINGLPVGKVLRNLFRAHAQGAERFQARVERAVINFFGMQLKVNPLVDAHRHDLLHIAGARTEGQAIERVQSAPLSVVIGAGCRLVLVFLSGQHLRDRTRQAETEKRDSKLRAAQAHEDSPGENVRLCSLSTRTDGKGCYS